MLPLLYYDQILIDSHEIDDILDHGDRSSFHEKTAHMLDLLLRNPTEQILYKKNKIPPRGQGIEIETKANNITQLLINETAGYSSHQPTLIKPVELKLALVIAYKEWIRYNRQKSYLLTDNEPLGILLKKDQIPKSITNLLKIRQTPTNDIINLLEKDIQLKKVLKELVRNALLIMDLEKDTTIRVYDYLIEEFLPTIELIERIRVFRDMPDASHKILNFSLLTEFYNFKLNKIKTKPRIRLNAAEAFIRILSERKRLSSLRHKMSEFESLINERDPKPTNIMKDLYALIKDINKKVNRIDTIGTWTMWGTGAIIFTEMVTSLSPVSIFILKTLLLNPVTVKITKEFLKDYYVALSGLNPKTSSYISIIKDQIGIRSHSELKGIYNVRPNIFKFWI